VQSATEKAGAEPQIAAIAKTALARSKETGLPAPPKSALSRKQKWKLSFNRRSPATANLLLRLFDAAYAAGAAAERNRFESSIHSCSPHCDRPACVATRRAVEEERERLRAQYGIVTDNGAALPDAMTQRHKPPEPLA
jgi:hypothetical protein